MLDGVNLPHVNLLISNFDRIQLISPIFFFFLAGKGGMNKYRVCLDGQESSYKIIISSKENSRLQHSLWHVMITLRVMRGAKQHTSFAFPPLLQLMFLHDESIP